MLTSMIIGMSAAAAGGLLGNYLYQKDVEANKYNEKFVPFASARAAVNKIKSASKNADNNFKEVVNGKDNPEPFTPDDCPFTEEELKEASYDKEVQEAKAENEAAEKAVVEAEAPKENCFDVFKETNQEKKETPVETPEPEKAPAEEVKQETKKPEKSQQQKQQKKQQQKAAPKAEPTVVETKQEEVILPKFTQAG